MKAAADNSRRDTDNANRAIHVTYELDAAAERVWNVLTEPKFVERWLFPKVIVWQVIRQYTAQTSTGRVSCHVLAADAHRRITYAWRCGRLDTEIRWALAPGEGELTRLQLVHAGFGADDAMAFQLFESWWQAPFVKWLTAQVTSRE